MTFRLQVSLILAIVFAVVFGTAPMLAHAAPNTAALSWTAPTTHEDGSPVGALTFNVYQGLSGQAKSLVGNVGTVTATISSGLLGGRTYCWHVTAVETATSLESGPSNEACKTFPPSPPAAPTALTVN